jgi:hypothetical protein
MNQTNTNANGRARKSLASQIDRLDTMLDGLGEGLNDAVAQAVKDAVSVAFHEAVRGVLNEILTNPDLLARLRAAQEAADDDDKEGAPPQQPSGRLAACRSWVGARLKQFGSWCKGCAEKVCVTATSAVRGVASVVGLGLFWARHQAAKAAKKCRFLWHAAFCAGCALAVAGAVQLAGYVTSALPSLSPVHWGGVLADFLARAVLWIRRLYTTYVYGHAEELAYYPA